MEVFKGGRMNTKEMSVMLNYLHSTSSQFLRLLDGTMRILTDWNQESFRIVLFSIPHLSQSPGVDNGRSNSAGPFGFSHHHKSPNLNS
jgi:hypothetical protein